MVIEHICFSLFPQSLVHSNRVHIWNGFHMALHLKSQTSLTWYSRGDMMLMSKRFHRAPTSFTSITWFKWPSVTVQTFSLLFAAFVERKKTLKTELTFVMKCLLYANVRIVTTVHELWWSTDTYRSVAWKPRIWDRCLLLGGGEGSVNKRFHCLLSGCCLAETGSDLDKGWDDQFKACCWIRKDYPPAIS